MSDGPHKSLPMSKAWKKVAESADNANFDSGQVTEFVAQAVVKNFRKEVPGKAVDLLKKEFTRREGYLFPDLRTEPLVEVEQAMGGSPLRRLLLDCAEQELAAGGMGELGLGKAMASAVRDRMQRATRQVEEHYQRHPDSTMARAANVRDRMREAIQRVSVDDVVRQVLGTQAVRSSRDHRRRGLDEGVPLR